MKWTMKDDRRYKHEVLVNLFGFKIYYEARCTGEIYPDEDMAVFEVGLYYLNKEGVEKWLIKPNWVR